MKKNRIEDIYKAMLMLLSSGMLLFAFPPYDMGLFAWFALIPALSATDGAGFKKGYLLGLVFSLSFQWMTLDWFGLFGWEPRLVGTIHWGLWYALFFGIYGWFSKEFPPGESWQRYLFIPALWTAMEWIKGNGILAFSWNFLGYSQYKYQSLIQIASITGVLGISFLIAFSNSLLSETILLIRKRFSGAKDENPPHGIWGNLPFIKEILTGFSRKDPSNRPLQYSWMGFTMVLLSVIIYGRTAIPLESRMGAYDELFKNPITVGVVQPSVPMIKKNNVRHIIPTLEHVGKVTDELAKNGASLVIWPESVIRFAIPLEDPTTSRMIKEAASRNEIFLTTGLQEMLPDRKTIYNSAYNIGPDGEVRSCYRKMHLVPLAEYNPLPKKYHDLPLFKPIGDYSHGKEQVLFKIPQGKFGVLICFESMFDYLARRAVKNGAGFLVVITNDAWFEFSSVAKIHYIMGMFRAVENRTWLVQSANTGISGIIDPWGRSVAETHLFRRESVLSSIFDNSGGTFYTKTGNWLPFLCLLFVAIIIIVQIKKNRKGKSLPADKKKR